MQTALQKALALILSGDRELGNILLVTAKTSLTSSLIALLIGVPLGIFLGASRFRGRQVLVILNRTLMGMPPVVCGLLLYLLFSEKTIEKYDAWTEKRDRFAKLFFWSIFLPIAPDDFLCYLAGTTTMTWKRYTAIILLGKPFNIALYSMGLVALWTVLFPGF